MVFNLGYKSAVGFGQETTYGTAVAPTDWAEFTSESFKGDYNKMLVEAINASAAYKKQVSLGQDVNGQIQFPVNPDDVIGMILKNFMGQAPTSAQQGTSTAYQHTFLGGNSYIADGTAGCGLTIQVIRDGLAVDYKGALATSLNFEIAANNILMCTASFSCQDIANQGTPGTPSFSALNPFTFSQGTVTKDGGAIQVTSCKISMDNRAQTDTHILGQTYIKRPATGGRLITGEVTMYSEDNNIYNDFTANTNREIILTFTGGVISGANNYILKFTLGKVYFTNNPTPNVSGKGILTYTAPFHAIWDDATDQDIKVTLQNTASSY